MLTSIFPRTRYLQLALNLVFLASYASFAEWCALHAGSAIRTALFPPCPNYFVCRGQHSSFAMVPALFTPFWSAFIPVIARRNANAKKAADGASPLAQPVRWEAVTIIIVTAMAVFVGFLKACSPS